MKFQKGHKINLGRKASEATRKKLSESKKGDKNPAKRLDVRKKLSESHKGHKHSEETKKKMSENNTRYWKGKKLSKEHREKLSKAHIGQSVGKDNPNWKGGVSSYTLDWTRTLKRAIRERDNYICQICSQYGNFIHHIDYIKANCSPKNLITLCHSCHTKTNHNRKHWYKFFITLIANKTNLK